MANYAKRYGRDTTDEARIDCPPPFIALDEWQIENAVASSCISLNPNTTELEVGAFGGQGVVIRWVPLTETATVAPRASVVASGLGADFDHWIPSGQLRRFIVPKETMGQVAGGQIGSVNGLYQRIAWINAGATATSILATEY